MNVNDCCLGVSCVLGLVSEDLDMMVLVRRMKAVDQEGLFIGVFSAWDRMSLYIAIDEFCDPFGCEFYVVPNGMGFLLNNFTSKEYESWFDRLEREEGDDNPPEVRINDISGGLFNKKMIKDNSLWQPLIEPKEKDFNLWYCKAKTPTEEDIANMEIW